MASTYRHTHKVGSIRAIKDHILVKDMNFGFRTLSSGILLPNDDATSAGIRPRWAQVYAIGPDQKDIKVGEWVLVEHGRWTRGFKIEVDGTEYTLRRVDPEAVMLHSDEAPAGDDNLSTAI
jgi:hypothetical protein